MRYEDVQPLGDDDYPVVLDPEAIGDPNQTPIVQLPPALAALFERTRCPECQYINHFHAKECSLGGES